MEENEEPSVQYNDHLPVMKTMRQWVHFFSFPFSKIASRQWNRCEKERLSIFVHGYFFSTMTRSKNITEPALWNIQALLVPLELNCDSQTSLFLLTWGFSVHPHCWHCRIATVGWLCHHTDASTNLYFFPAPWLPCISQKGCEQSYHSEMWEEKEKKRKPVSFPQLAKKNF